MKIGLNKRQYELITELVKKEVKEQGDVNSEPSAGTSQTQSGASGYPEVGKWESGVTRGPGNQVGVTKWSDVVGASLKRGKGNQLKESLVNEQTSPFYFPVSQNGKLVRYDYSQGRPITKPKGSVDLSLLPKELIPDPKNPPRTISVEDMNKNYWFNPRILKITPEFENSIKSYKKESYIDKPRPQEPIPTIEYIRQKSPEIKSHVMSSEYNKKINSKNRFDEYIFWSYDSPIEGYIEGYKKDLMNKYEFEVDLWLQANRGITLQQEKNFIARKTPDGKIDVPKGFDPSRYPEYLSKTKPLNDRLKVLSKSKKLQGGSVPEYTDEQKKEIQNINEKLKALKNEYYSLNFSYGIRKEELKLYNNRIKEINDEFLKKYKEIFGVLPTSSKKQSTSLNNQNIDNTYVYKLPTQPDLRETKLLKKKNEQIQALNFMFGKDDWYKDVGMFGESFDRWWDEWGGYVDFFGNIAVIAFSGGIAAFIEGTAIVGARMIGVQLLRSGTVRAIAPYAVDSMFNTLVGSYKLSRNDKSGALLSLICALVPFVSYGKNIGRITFSEAESLVKKIKTADFSSSDKIQQFVSTLTENERYIFRNASTLSKEGIKKGYDEIISIAKEGIESAGVKIPKVSLKKWGTPILKTLAVEGGPPTAYIFADVIFDFFKQNSKREYRPDELTDLKEWLKLEVLNMTPAQATHVSKEVTSKPESTKDIPTLKKEVAAAALDYNPSDKQTLIDAARSIGAPDDWFINREKYKNVKLKDILKGTGETPENSKEETSIENKPDQQSEN
jgi:hypothetical protein